MLHIYLGNRPDVLATVLATRLRAAPLPLLESEPVVVPSTAVARWLGLRMADALGIATQTAYPFPAAYVWQLFGRVLPDVATTNPFDRAAMQWRLLRLLGESRSIEIRQYLVGDDGVRQYELAGKLAVLFDRYLVERPDWIAAWNAGKRLGLGPDEAWQAGLWQALMSELSGIAPDHPRERFFARLKESERARERLPRRISLFAVEAMPALYWDVFVGLAEWIELHVFVLAPSREYWGDIDRLRERLRISIDHPAAAVLYETGHPLLASLGRARQHAVVRLAEAAERVASAEYANFVEPPATLLGTLQHDILELTSSTGVPADATLQIHACHGAQREAEVLLDRLLELFEKLPDLRPADILILAPDIETYAPIVAAVLMHAVAAHRIPCTVADRPLAAAPIWRALHRLCVVAAGDLDAESVMSLLDEPALRRAFDIAENDLPRLRDWVKESGIRWGVDGATHNWRAGLRRLLLGVALPDVQPGAPERLWNDLLPVTGIEGERAELLGRFADFVEALFDLNTKVGAGETAPGWCRLLIAAVERFLAPDETEESQAQRLREVLGHLGELARAAECTTRLPLSVMLRELDAQLAEQAPAQAFASGTATIAALQPGRPLPARVVCLVGMNDGAWPRPATPLDFDLVASHPRPGDRNRRGEERHAFLETLLCAADALVVTYTGRDPRTNLEQPPAAPLAELLDTLAAMTGADAETLVVQHPLQPFGAAYFEAKDERLFSFDAEHCATGSAKSSPPFVPPTTQLEPQGSDTVELDRLQRFFSNPVRYFLRECLGIHLEESEELLETVEPFVPDRLEAYRLREAHFAALAAGMTPGETVRLLRARGWLPQGVAGDLADRTAHDEAAPLWQAVRPWATAERLPPCEAIFAAGGINLSGRFDGLSERGLWRVRHGRLRPQDRLRLWLDHLLLNIAEPAGVALQSVLFARDGAMHLAPEPRAAEYLADLLAIYREGLQSPLPFYPETAWAWLEQKNWRRAWEGDAFNQKPGERDDPYVRLALRDRADDPLEGGGPSGQAFQNLAARIFGPLQAAMKVGDG
ncbi:MAG: exodeoxyribonuclease V subunit gamma [Rhodocyclaceae bacterium]|nr:exodeoxyribonuclease V subunit gamma [Rhodocyclaceae bacterium]